MKKNRILFILAIVVLSCEREDVESLNVEHQENCVIADGEGLAMKFCLLNMDGNPQSVFKENENFMFSLTLENQSESTIVINKNLIDSDFFRVISIVENKDFGVPYTGTWCEYSLAPEEISIKPRESRVIECSWFLKDGAYANYPLCKAEGKEYLPSGNYITGIDNNFSVKKGENTISLYTIYQSYAALKNFEKRHICKVLT